jgi:tetratricopeptide (TPR) repeat protein
MKYKVLASIVPLLALITLVFGYMVFKYRGAHKRLAKERRGNIMILIHLEQARGLIEQSERYLRAAEPDHEAIRDMAEEAIRLLTEAMGRHPDSEEAFRLRGRALELTNNFEAALDDYREALEKHPESPARFALGLLETRRLARARLNGLKTASADETTLQERAVEPLRRFQAVPKEFGIGIDWKLRAICTTCISYAEAHYERVAGNASSAEGFDETEWFPHYLAGIAFAELGKNEEAAKRLAVALRTLPGAADPHAWIGEVYRRLGFIDRALTHLSRALMADPHFLEAYLVRARILFDNGRFGDARIDLSAAERLHPALPENVRRMIGIANYESWEREGRTTPAYLLTADRAFTSLLKEQPEAAGDLLYRARVRLALGNADDAAVDIDVVSKLTPDSHEVLEVRARVREAQRRWEEADRDRTRLFKETNNSRMLLMRARVRGRAGWFDKALADYDTLLERDPHDAGTWIEKARLQLRAGRTDEALATTAKASEQFRGNTALRVLRAEILLNTKDFKAAESEASEALKIDPQYAPALVVRARARLESGRRAEAAADLEQAVEIRPDLKDELAPLLEQVAPPR